MKSFTSLVFSSGVLLFIGVIATFMPNYNLDPYVSKQSKLINQILLVSGELIEKRYGLSICGSGTAMPSGVVKELTLSLSSTNALSKQEIRKILIGAADILLKQIQQNVEIQEYLEKSPATLDAVQIIVFNFDKNRMYLNDPEIATGEINGELLTYSTNDLENDILLKNECVETYVEALAKIKNDE